MKKIDKSLTIDYDISMKQREILRKAASALGSIRTAKKAASSRLNGKLYGGRPKKK